MAVIARVTVAAEEVAVAVVAGIVRATVVVNKFFDAVF